MEEIAIVNSDGIVQCFSRETAITEEDVVAVELVLLYLPEEKEIVLLNRGNGASDMQAHWALESGKVNRFDLTSEDGVGKKLSLGAYRNAAIREFDEELNFTIPADRLKVVDEFYMKSKQLYFTLLALPLKKQDLARLYPDQCEIDRIRRFTLPELENNTYLGDALMYRKEAIVRFLQREFQALRNIYVVVCNGISDIGKGWLTAALIGLDPQNTLPIKIDPLLNLTFPQNLGIPIKDICASEDVDAFIHQGRASSANFRISEDIQTYSETGVRVYPECNIVAGDLINRFLNTPDEYIRKNEIKKRTFNDLARFLATEITTIARKRNPRTLVIEVGGTVEDMESVYIPGAMRFLQQQDFLGITPEIVLLTYFEFAESYDQQKYRIKTQHIRRGIINTSKVYYHLPLKACLVRRRNVPDVIPDTVLVNDLENVAYETQIPPQKIALLHNVNAASVKANLECITEIIRRTGIF